MLEKLSLRCEFENRTMANWITIITFNHDYDAHLAKSRLEADGIEVILKDELTTQLQHHINAAIGGIKLQVKEEQLIKALHILKSLGYNLGTTKQDMFWKKLEQYTNKLPVINQFDVQIRFMFIAAIVMLLLGIPIYFFFAQSIL